MIQIISTDPSGFVWKSSTFYSTNLSLFHFLFFLLFYLFLSFLSLLFLMSSLFLSLFSLFLSLFSLSLFLSQVTVNPALKRSVQIAMTILKGTMSPAQVGTGTEYEMDGSKPTKTETDRCGCRYRYQDTYHLHPSYSIGLLPITSSIILSCLPWLCKPWRFYHVALIVKTYTFHRTLYIPHTAP